MVRPAELPFHCPRRTTPPPRARGILDRICSASRYWESVYYSQRDSFSPAAAAAGTGAAADDVADAGLRMRSHRRHPGWRMYLMDTHVVGIGRIMLLNLSHCLEVLLQLGFGSSTVEKLLRGGCRDILLLMLLLRRLLLLRGSCSCSSCSSCCCRC